MKQQKMIHDVLENISRKNIPDDATLLPEIQRVLKTDRGTSRAVPLRRVSTAILIALAVVFLLATVAYAAYRLFWDPGLQGVKEAGLGADVNTTAQSTFLPEVTPMSGEQKPAMMVGASQTLEGVTVTLDWVSLNGSRLIFGFTSSGLPDGVSFGMPLVAFNNAAPQQLRGSSLILSGGEPTNGEFVSYQVVNDILEGGTASLGIDLPLVQKQADGEQVLATFHYDLIDVPADSGQPTSGQQTYSTKVNGMGIRLEWLRITETATTAQLCFDLPSAGEDWKLSLVTVQYGDAKYNLRGDAVLAEKITPVSADDQQRCVNLDFPIGTGGDAKMLKLSVAELTNGSDRRKGAWDFNVMLPETLNIQTAQATPTQAALDIKTIGDLTATLQWAYADSHRVALLIHFDGWQEGYGAGVLVTDDSGAEINTGYGWGSPGDDPSTFLLTLYFAEPSLTNADHIAFHVDFQVVTLQDQGKPLASFRFDLDLPVYQARVALLDQTITANGLDMHLVKASITPSYTELTLCYQKPSHGDWSDWMIGSSAELQIGESKTGTDSYGILSDSDYGGYAGKGVAPTDLPLMDNGRCVKIGFPLGDLAKPGPTAMTLTVQYLEISMPEVIPDDQLLPALEKLKAQGIDVSVYTSSSGGGGGGGWTINSKPEGMSDQEAYQKFMDALGYIYNGPWIFEILIP
jgi:hypothetical protein